MEKRGGTSCLECGVSAHPLVHGASTFPRQLPPGFGLILLALNLKVISQVDLIRSSCISGEERCLCHGGDRAVGVESWAGLGFGGGASWGWEGSRPRKCSEGPGFWSRAADLSLEKSFLTALFLPGWKRFIGSTPNQIWSCLKIAPPDSMSPSHQPPTLG